MKPGEVLIDFPAKPTMLATDLLVRFPNGEVRNASELGPDDGFALTPATQQALYAASGSIAVFVAEPRRIDRTQVAEHIKEAERLIGCTTPREIVITGGQESVTAKFECRKGS